MRKLAALLAVVLAALAAVILHAASPQQLTANAATDSWSQRTSSTSQGMVLWTDIADGAFVGSDVLFFDGTTVSTVQTLGALTGVNDTNAFALGTGASPGDVIGVWRRDSDFAWVWTRAAGGATTLKEVKATNPINAANPMNPEAVAVADGCVFLILQPAANVKHVFRVDPATGTGTLLTNGAAVPGAGRVTTSGCKAAWMFDDGTATKLLQFYNGTSVSTIDTGDLDGAYMNQGRIVYTKIVSGIQQIFLYDTTLVSPSPVQLSNDVSGTNDLPRTDGRHVAWVHQDGANWDVVLSGGLILTSDTATRPQINVNEDNTFQLQRGQLLWKDTSGNPRYHAGGRLSYLPIAPATSFERFWLADGFIAWLGTGGSDAGADKEAFRLAVTAPADAAQPAAPLAVVAAPGASQATVSWDRIVGATSYNVYMARVPGVTKDNYQTLAGGTRFTGATSPFVATGLNARGTYHFVVTAVEGATEGPSSPEAHASLTASLVWTAAPGLTTVNVRTVAADRANPAVAYAAGNVAAAYSVYRTTNSGADWSPLAGGIESLDVRALAADGLKVYAATKDGDIWRSLDGGASWNIEYDGNDIGEQNKALIIDPFTPTTLYAGNFELLVPVPDPADSFLLKSTNSGDTWVALPEPSVPDAEQRAYSLAVDPVSGGFLYAGGNAVPTLARSGDGGATWTSIIPSTGTVLGLAADSRQATSLYAGMMKIGNTISWGIYKSTTEGASWALKNAGLPVTLPRIFVLLADPVNPAYLHAGTDSGYFFSLDGAENWSAANTGLPSIDFWNALAMTGSRRLLAATSVGLFVLDLSIPAVAPAITTHPQSQSILSGQTATMNVVATGTAPLSYQWYIGTSGTTTTPVGGATSTSYTTPALTTTTSYWVRVSNLAGAADSNTATISITNGFTDDPLTPGSTIIKTVHITELRSRINAVRAARGLEPYPYTDLTLTTGTTAIRSVHITDLRTALAQAYVVVPLTPPTYTDPDLAAGAMVKAVHVAEIRAAVVAIE